MGNVSQEIPGIHPVFDIGCQEDIHTIEFCSHANSLEAFEYTMKAAQCLMLTAKECILNNSILQQVRLSFEALRS